MQQRLRRNYRDTRYNFYPRARVVSREERSSIQSTMIEEQLLKPYSRKLRYDLS